MTHRVPTGRRAGAALSQRRSHRRHRETLPPRRDPFEIDRQRIVTCTAFRRLERKTQVFSAAYHDHFRTRLTHTLEVTLLARRLAVLLDANESLTEAITLAHDLGHPPFGHAGEAALNQAMEDQGGFNHNAHTLRVVQYLEHPFPAFRGLNLTMATLDGLTSHSTRYDKPADNDSITPSVEAQIASVADRVAYNCHDLEDAMGAGLLTAVDLNALDLWNNTCRRANIHSPADNLPAIRRTILDAMLDHFVEDIVTTTQDRLVQSGTADAVAPSVAFTVALSDNAESELVSLERFLQRSVYSHSEIAQTDAHGQAVIQALFEAYEKTPAALPERFARRIEDQGCRRVLCDYMAGMTDRFCEREYARLVRAM